MYVYRKCSVSECDVESVQQSEYALGGAVVCEYEFVVCKVSSDEKVVSSVLSEYYGVYVWCCGVFCDSDVCEFCVEVYSVVESSDVCVDAAYDVG